MESRSKTIARLKRAVGVNNDIIYSVNLNFTAREIEAAKVRKSILENKIKELEAK